MDIDDDIIFEVESTFELSNAFIKVATTETR